MMQAINFFFFGGTTRYVEYSWTKDRTRVPFTGNVES